MKEFQCDDPSVRILGGAIHAWVSVFGPYKARGERTLCRHLGVQTVSTAPDASYPLSKFFDGMREMRVQVGDGFLRSVGRTMLEKAIIPPGFDCFASTMSLIQKAYELNHSPESLGKVGTYRWQRTGERQGLFVSDAPYPCPFDQGLVEGVALRFKHTVRVIHDPERPCRSAGDEQCTYRVEW